MEYSWYNINRLSLDNCNESAFEHSLDHCSYVRPFGARNTLTVPVEVSKMQCRRIFPVCMLLITIKYVETVAWMEIWCVQNTYKWFSAHIFDKKPPVRTTWANMANATNRDVILSILNIMLIHDASHSRFNFLTSHHLRYYKARNKQKIVTFERNFTLHFLP